MLLWQAWSWDLASEAGLVRAVLPLVCPAPTRLSRLQAGGGSAHPEAPVPRPPPQPASGGSRDKAAAVLDPPGRGHGQGQSGPPQAARGSEHGSGAAGDADRKGRELLSTGRGRLRRIRPLFETLYVAVSHHSPRFPEVRLGTALHTTLAPGGAISGQARLQAALQQLWSSERPCAPCPQLLLRAPAPWPSCISRVWAAGRSQTVPAC